MGDLIGIIVLIIVFNALSGKDRKKKHQKKAQNAQTASEKKKTVRMPKESFAYTEPESLHPAAERMLTELERDIQSCARDTAVQSVKPDANAPAKQAPCPVRRDECFSLDGTEPEKLRSDLLRGVIMSEILTRPAERAQINKMRLKRYHGQ